MALRVADPGPVDNADRLGPFRLEIDTRAGGCTSWPNEAKCKGLEHNQPKVSQGSPLFTPDRSLFMQRPAHSGKRLFLHRLCRIPMLLAVSARPGSNIFTENQSVAKWVGELDLARIVGRVLHAGTGMPVLFVPQLRVEAVDVINLNAD